MVEDLGHRDEHSDAADIEAVVLDYIEGWYHGDVRRMDTSLHSDLVKRAPAEDEPGKVGRLRSVSRDRMLELTSDGGGKRPEVDIEIVVDHIDGDVAAARVSSPDYLDYLQMIRTTSGWKILNVLFRSRA